MKGKTSKKYEPEKTEPHSQVKIKQKNKQKVAKQKQKLVDEKNAKKGILLPQKSKNITDESCSNSVEISINSGISESKKDKKSKKKVKNYLKKLKSPKSAKKEKDNHESESKFDNMSEKTNASPDKDKKIEKSKTTNFLRMSFRKSKKYKNKTPEDQTVTEVPTVTVVTKATKVEVEKEEKNNEYVENSFILSDQEKGDEFLVQDFPPLAEEAKENEIKNEKTENFVTSSTDKKSNASMTSMTKENEIVQIPLEQMHVSETPPKKKDKTLSLDKKSLPTKRDKAKKKNKKKLEKTKREEIELLENPETDQLQALISTAKETEVIMKNNLELIMVDREHELQKLYLTSRSMEESGSQFARKSNKVRKKQKCLDKCPCCWPCYKKLCCVT